MPQTQRRSLAHVHHRIPSAVELDRLDDRVLSLARGARKQRAAPKGCGEHQLFRDLFCGKNKAFGHVRKYVFANLRDGESLDDILAPLWCLIHAATESCGDDAQLAFDEYLRLDSEMRAEQARIELEYALGNHSTPVMAQLESTIERHQRLLEQEGAALHEKMYRSRSAVA